MLSCTGKRSTAVAVERRQLSSAGNAFLITKQTRVEVRRALLRQSRTKPTRNTFKFISAWTFPSLPTAKLCKSTAFNLFAQFARTQMKLDRKNNTKTKTPSKGNAKETQKLYLFIVIFFNQLTFSQRPLRAAASLLINVKK